MRRLEAMRTLTLALLAASLVAGGCSEPDQKAGGAEDPAAAPVSEANTLRRILEDPDGFARTTRLANLLAGLGPEAVPEVRSALDDPWLEVGAVESVLLVRFWATHEPQAATDWAWTRALKPFFGVGPLMESVEVWARSDPEAVLQAIADAGVGPITLHAEKALVRGWFRSGQPGLEEWIRGLPQASDSQQRALRVVARERIRRDGSEAAVRWADALPDEPWRIKLAAYRQLANELALADPAAAAAWCEAHCEDERFGSNLRMLIAAGWAKRDGAGALEWLSTAPAGLERDRAVREALGWWMARDPEAAGRFVLSQDPGQVEPWLRAGAGVFANRVAWDDPEKSMEWVALIEDDTVRRDHYVTLVRWWRGQDEAAADAWLSRSSLSEETRGRILNPPQRRQRRRPAPTEGTSAGADQGGSQTIASPTP